MNSKQVLTLAAVGVAAVWLWNKVNTGNSLQLQFQNVNIRDLSLTNTGLTLTFTLINPTAADITLSNLQGLVYVNGTEFATVSSSESVDVPAFGTIPYSVNATITGSLLSEIETVASLIQNNSSIPVSFVGSIQAEGFTTSINQNLTV